MTSSSSDAALELWFDGRTRLFAVSRVTNTPARLRPLLAVALAPHDGLTTVRVKTASMGVEKTSIPSRKNGRFSG